MLEVEYSSQFYIDLERITEYLVDNFGLLTTYKRLALAETKIQIARKSPLSYPQFGNQKDIRKMPVTPGLILYQTEANRILIKRFVDARRQLSDLRVEEPKATYASSGVDKEEGYRAVELMKQKVAATHNENVLHGLGSFGAFYALKDYKNPVLVSGTDGVGTKLKVAFDVGKYNTVGIDCVAMCVNDVLCHGAQPLFFLDYLACGKLEAEVAAEIVGGIAEGCKQSGAALIGGETAEMPGFYQEGDYDIAGFTVGAVERSQVIDGTEVQSGDAIIGLASSGVHSNGFSLVRKLITNYQEDFMGKPMFETLLEPTRIYVKPVLNIMEKFDIHGLAHITGGGLIENVPRALNNNVKAVIEKDKIQILPIFNHLMELGVPEKEMWGTFNMGIGFIIIVPEDQSQEVLFTLNQMNCRSYILGHIEEGKGELDLH